MKHLEIEQLKKYGERRLSGAELTRAVLHLDGCASCFEAFQKLFPAASNRLREVSLDVLTGNEAEDFHLNYETHLRPFADGDADAVTTEIVESHISNCSLCARVVGELCELSDNFKQRETESVIAVAPPFYQALGFSIGNAGRLFFPVVAVLILGIGGWLIWRQTVTRNFTAESHSPKDAPLIATNENDFKQPPANLMNQEVAETNLPSPSVKNDSVNKTVVAAEDEKRDANQAADEVLLAALPPEFRASFRNAVETQRVNLPAFVADLRRENSLRSASNSERKVVVAPVAQAARDARPVFRWRKFGDGDGETYVVTIYDEKFNQIAVSPNLSREDWRSNVALERGKIYEWQVKAEKSAEFYAARFKVLDEAALMRLKRIENAAPHSPFARGIGYASEGLLSEAAREFQKEIAKNPRGILAKKLKAALAEKGGK